MFLCHLYICGLAQDVKKTVSGRGKFTESLILHQTCVVLGKLRK